MHTIYLLKNSAKYFGPYVEKLVKYAFPSKSKMWDINKTFVKYLTEYKNKMESKFEDLKKQNNISNDINIYEYNDIFSELTKKCSEYIKDCNNYYNKHKLLYSVYRQKLAQCNTLIGTIQEYMQYFENALRLIVNDNQKLQQTRNKIVIDNKNTALN